MSICHLIRVDESFFDGYELPETVQDALIFFMTEMSDDNNIPRHIMALLRSARENPDMEEEKMIEEAQKYWLVDNIKQQLDRNESNKNLKIECLHNIVCLCLDNYDTYKKLGKFIEVTDYKIKDLLDNVDKNCIYYVKAKELQDLHIRDSLIPDST